MSEQPPPPSSSSSLVAAFSSHGRKRGRLAAPSVEAPAREPDSDAFLLMTDAELAAEAKHHWTTMQSVLGALRSRGMTSLVEAGALVVRDGSGQRIGSDPAEPGTRTTQDEIDALFACPDQDSSSSSSSSSVAAPQSQPLSRSERLRQATARHEEAMRRCALEKRAEMERREQAIAERRLAQAAKQHRVPNAGFEREPIQHRAKPKKKWKASWQGTKSKRRRPTSSNGYDRDAWRQSEWRDGFED